MSRKADLNRWLTECQQIYERLGSVGPNLASLDPIEFTEERRLLLAGEFLSLLSAVEEVEHLLGRVRLDHQIQDVAPQPLRIYRDCIAPNRKKLAPLIVELLNIELDPEVYSSDEDDPQPKEEGSPVWGILASGLDYWENDSSGMHSEDELKAADRLLYSSFFRPDQWLRNADELEPVMGRAADRRIPANIRVRLQELYRSFILGNHLSAISLARAILEYALVDRAVQLDINPYSDDPRHPGRTRKLGILVDDAAEKRPDLKSLMESVVDAGNKTMHPKKKDTLVLLPNALRHLALVSIDAVRKIVEDLYLEQ